MNKAKDIPFFFIIGRPRSGTTLLRLLIEAHPHVIIPPESPVILSLYKKYEGKKVWQKEDLEDLIEDLYRQQYFEAWLIKKEVLRKRLIKLTGEISFLEIIRELYQAYPSMFPKENIQLIGDKNPVYALYIKRIHKLFPDSKFIYISRDYRDNYLSLIRVNFEIPLVPLVVYRWKFAYRQFRKLEKEHPARFYFIRYEDLASNPETVIKKVYDFLGLDFRQEVFDFYKKKEEMQKAYGHSEELMDIHRSLLNPINTGRINTWKKKMSEKQIRMADLVAGKTADECGYERKYKGFDLWLYLRMLPLLTYGKIMYQLMLWGERLPYKARSALLEFLGIFLRVYWSLNKEKLNKKEKETP
ncbi:MAG: sulfotransferase [Bacteroidota bacterium]|nr:sulfotransferase [Bacteroidota bacterium]